MKTQEAIKVATLETRCDNLEKDQASILSYVKAVDKKVANMRDNHLAHLKSDISEIKRDMAVIKNNLKWMMTIGSTIGGVIGGGITLIINMYT